MYETMSESRKRRGSRHLMWPSKKSFTCTHVSNSDGDSWWFSFVLNIHIYIYMCTLFMLHRCLWPYIYIYINTNMKINIIDYNGISIWTMCSKTKSWKTHYVTRGLGAPLVWDRFGTGFNSKWFRMMQTFSSRSLQASDKEKPKGAVPEALHLALDVGSWIYWRDFQMCPSGWWLWDTFW